MKPGGLRELLDRRVVLFDAGLGARLARAGPPATATDLADPARLADVATLTAPERVRALHAADLAAGADAVTTNTFGASAATLARFGLGERLAELNRAAVELARAACDAAATPERPRFVLGSLGPGWSTVARGETDAAALEASYAPQVRALASAGVDALLIETAVELAGVRAALRAVAREAPGLPTLVFATVGVDGRLPDGTPVHELPPALAGEAVALLGLNCSGGPRTLAPAVASLAAASPLPLGASPNAGLPQREAGELVWPVPPLELADWLARFVLEDGARLVGGCCGTTAEHVRAAADALLGPGGPRRPPAVERVAPVPLRTIESLPLAAVAPYVDAARAGLEPAALRALLKELAHRRVLEPAAGFGAWTAAELGEDGAPAHAVAGALAVALGPRARDWACNPAPDEPVSGDVAPGAPRRAVLDAVLEGLAEHVHGQLRAAWGTVGADARSTDALCAGHYRGARVRVPAGRAGRAAPLAPLAELAERGSGALYRVRPD